MQRQSATSATSTHPLHLLKDRLSNDHRTKAFYDAIYRNTHHFQGKDVLTLGIGSIAFAIWAAKVGAKKVFLVEEDANMAGHVRDLIKENELEETIKVFEGALNDVDLLHPVDVIISDWMGHFLLHESTFDSVIMARDTYLTHNGVMYPSHAYMWLAPIRSAYRDQLRDAYEQLKDDWFEYEDYTESAYGVKTHSLGKYFRIEQRKKFLKTATLVELHPDQVIGLPAMVEEFNCLTAENLKEVTKPLNSTITAENTKLCGFAAWFHVEFRGRPENPVQTSNPVLLDTAPSDQFPSYLGQQVFHIKPVAVLKGDVLNINFSMKASSKSDYGSYKVNINCEIEREGSIAEVVGGKFYLSNSV